MTIEAVGFRVVIKPDPIMEKTKSGIFLAVNEALEKGATVTGTVVHVGPEAFRAFNRNAGFQDYVPWVKPGDRVFYAKYAGKGVQDPTNREEYLIVNDEDIVSKIIDDTDELATKGT